jgi:hypothetical protein
MIEPMPPDRVQQRSDVTDTATVESAEVDLRPVPPGNSLLFSE